MPRYGCLPLRRVDQEVERAEIDVMDYDKKWGRYRLRLAKGDVKKHRDFLTKLPRQAYGADAESSGQV